MFQPDPSRAPEARPSALAPNRGWRLLGKRFLSQEGASNVLEAALVLPVYLMLVFSFTSYAIVLFAYCNACYASKAGARYASTHSGTSLLPCTAASIQSLVTPFLWGAPAGGATVTTTWSAGNTIGSIVTVNVSMTYKTGMPYTNFTGMVVSTSAQQVVVH